MDSEFQFCKMKKVLDVNGGDGCTANDRRGTGSGKKWDQFWVKTNQREEPG